MKINNIVDRYEIVKLVAKNLEALQTLQHHYEEWLERCQINGELQSWASDRTVELDSIIEKFRNLYPQDIEKMIGESVKEDVNGEK